MRTFSKLMKTKLGTLVRMLGFIILQFFLFCVTSTNEEVIMRMWEYLGGADNTGHDISIVALHTAHIVFVLQSDKYTDKSCHYQIQ